MDRKESGLLLVSNKFSSILSVIESQGVTTKTVQADSCSYYGPEYDGHNNEHLLLATRGAYKHAECKVQFEGYENFGFIGVQMMMEREIREEFKDYEVERDGYLYLITHTSRLINFTLYGLQWANTELVTENGILVQN